jgi:hypothetical protein
VVLVVLVPILNEDRQTPNPQTLFGLFSNAMQSPAMIDFESFASPYNTRGDGYFKAKTKSGTLPIGNQTVGLHLPCFADTL